MCNPVMLTPTGDPTASKSAVGFMFPQVKMVTLQKYLKIILRVPPLNFVPDVQQRRGAFYFYKNTKKWIRCFHLKAVFYFCGWSPWD